jgi:CheY-like chemotaxis protein
LDIGGSYALRRGRAVTGAGFDALVFDAIVRQTLIRLLTARGGMEVTVASDAMFALAKMRRERPDVIVLDLALPRMHGLSR